MVDYQPIVELVKQIPADTWKILQEIQKRRSAMMLDELLERPMHERPVLLNVLYKTRTEG